MSPQNGNSGVLAFAEEIAGLAKLAAVGSELARAAESTLSAVVLAGEVSDDPATLFACGYHEVVRVSYEPHGGFAPERYEAILTEIVAQRRPLITLFDSSRVGTEVCGRVSQRLGTVAATGCRKIRLEGDGLVVERLAYGGRFTVVQRFERRPFFASMVPGSQPQANSRAGGGKVTDVRLSLPESSVRLEGESATSSGEGLERAERIVAVGRGLRRKEDLGMISELASALGAAVAATRPLTEEFGWLPRESQVGISGKTVKPKLYLACGVSGQIQHAAGMRDARVVVAINTDRDAPIFQEADYRIIGDLYEVVPALTKTLQKRKGASAIESGK